MALPPYTAGDRLVLALPAGPLPVTVSAVVSIPARDPGRRWRLLCRDEVDGSSVELPVYCDDDGVGELIANERTPAARA